MEAMFEGNVILIRSVDFIIDWLEVVVARTLDTGMHSTRSKVAGVVYLESTAAHNSHHTDLTGPTVPSQLERWWYNLAPFDEHLPSIMR